MVHRRTFLAALACCAIGTIGRAAEAPKATDDDLRIRGIFETALPRTEKRQSIRLILHPHLGDLRERDYLRTAVGFRYGLTDRWETTAEADWYFSHGLKDVAVFREQGFSSVHLGTKYLLGKFGASGWECSIGSDFTRPVGSPPPSVTDGLQHVAPYVALSRQFARWPNWRFFCGVGYDFVTATSIAGQLSKNQLNDDSVSFSGGLLWSRGTTTYTLETSYATMHLTRDSTRDVFTLRPGVVWVVPPAYTLGSKGKWLLGFALRASQGVDGTDLGASAKLRVNFDFRRLLGRPAEPRSGAEPASSGAGSR